MNRKKELARLIALIISISLIFLVYPSHNSKSVAATGIPEGFKAELFAINVGAEDFAFDNNENLWAGAGGPGEVIRESLMKIPNYQSMQVLYRQV